MLEQKGIPGIYVPGTYTNIFFLIRLYAATPLSGPGLPRAAARFVSAKKATSAARGCRANVFDLVRMRGAARQSEASSMSGRLVNCSSAAVQLQKKQSQSLRLDPYA